MYRERGGGEGGTKEGARLVFGEFDAQVEDHFPELLHIHIPL